MEQYQVGDSIPVDNETQLYGASHISINQVKHIDLLERFEYFGVFKMIGLSIITLTFYFPYWFSKQSKVLNSCENGTGFSLLAIVFLFMMTFFDMCWTVVEIINDDAKWSTDIGNIVSKIDRLTLLIATFSMRKRLHAALKIGDQSKHWIHGLWTFLFGAFYIQYKINQMKQDFKAGTFTTQGDKHELNESITKPAI